MHYVALECHLLFSFCNSNSWRHVCDPENVIVADCFAIEAIHLTKTVLKTSQRTFPATEKNHEFWCNGASQRLLMRRGPVRRSKRRRGMVLVRTGASWRTRQDASDRVPAFYKPPAAVCSSTHMPYFYRQEGIPFHIQAKF